MNKSLPFSIAVLFSLSLVPKDKALAEKPNIIIFMVDDLGWNHISAARATMGTSPKAYWTPNIDKLAQQGLSFTHAYAQPTCSPTRAAMLSGQYPARIHNEVYQVDTLNRKLEQANPEPMFLGPEQSLDVAPQAVTIAEALKKNGYTTAHIGKYHVGGHRGSETMPENAGFDINIGGNRRGHQNACFASNEENSWKFYKTGDGAFDRFAVTYDRSYVEKYGYPKELIGTPKHITDAITDALEETIRQLNEKEDPFYLQLFTYAVHVPVEARPDLKRESQEKATGSTSADYLGFIRGFDIAMGRLMAALEDPNGDGKTSDSISKNTLILFTSDNGGTLTHNLPLKGDKGMFTEGGIRVPLIARWPGVIPANTATDYKVHSVDYYPTCLELAGGKWMPDKDEHPLDGESFVDILTRPETNRERGAIFYLFPGYNGKRARPCAVVIDDIKGKRYKLWYHFETRAWELYNLAEDIGERKDLFKKHPDIAKTLSQKLGRWLDQKHPTWRPKYPLDKETGKSTGPPPIL